ncbi:ATP-dependent zinc metalloprotease FtsH [Xanthocytophaga agilis]|uniref:ATP-dependent zinc metalloprotease FtsH n=1 Tax=Xanthocytophaga agilis TaxID=3048010 RepID=A0AAE3RA40_9BACT|nr:ATP-dependent zinc metalloprotease FtsH [Xanthocytophaga agilis]MDJ1506451.1 ATP-dependent zinc metalloprotease FtsH [Xanthocytophaga agilis]
MLSPKRTHHRKKSDQLDEQESTPKKISNWLSVLFFILTILFLIFTSNSAVKQISWKEFDNTLLQKNAVAKVEIVDNELVSVYLKRELAEDPRFKDVFYPNKMGKILDTGPHYQFVIGSVDVFERKLEQAQKNIPENDRVEVVYIRKSNGWTTLLAWIIPFILLLFLLRYISSRPGAMGDSSVFNFGKSTALLQEKENKSTICFDDVAGLEEAKVEVKEIVDFLKDPTIYTHLGAKIPRGIMLIGPPGTGKTLLVKAVAGQAQVPFFSISGSEFVEMFVGVGASRVRDLFKQAKAKAPCIIFIDEIDAVGRLRSKNAFYTGANDERESTLNQLLTEMDGFSANTGIIVLAATNRADMLDPALLRPGRFDRHIYLELPNLTERKAIFKVHLQSIRAEDSLDVDFLSGQTPGFSGADIANICNEAALIAARNKKEKVEKADFINAVDRVIAGLEKKSKIISEKEKKIIVYHEAGHALVSWMLKHVDPLIKVSIVPRGQSLGAAWYLPEERQIKTRTEFVDILCATLGGRAAEEIIFGDVSSGALDDLEKATKQAYTMIAYYGFDKKIGNISFYDSAGNQNPTLQKPYSEQTGNLIDEQVRNLIESAYQRTKSLLEEHKDSLQIMAELLLQKEVIFKEDMEKVLGKRLSEQVNKNLVSVF